MNEFFKIDDRIEKIANEVENSLEEVFKNIDKNTEYNQNKVLKSFIDNKISEACLAGTTGYGYNDMGREKLEKVMAQIFGTEDCFIRHTFASGTSALSTALFGILRPNDILLSVVGTPYDTLQGVIGITPGSGSLKEFGIKYEQVELKNNEVDFDAIRERLENGETPKVVYIQRSKGYATRASLRMDIIEKICEISKKYSPESIIVVDNCYGEYVQEKEPTQVGADMIIGSLIKNVGGGIAPCGGYIASTEDLVEKCACRHTAPGVGKEVGATVNQLREMYMGVFNGPHLTGEAIKTAAFAAGFFEKLGFEVSPKSDEPRADIIQTIILGTDQGLISFCQGMQSGMPVDSFVCPEPWDMPGYESQVIMSSGSFTSGATSELSADGPLREPFAAWMQGALNYHSGKTGIMLAANSMLKNGVKLNLK